MSYKRPSLRYTFIHRYKYRLEAKHTSTSTSTASYTNIHPYGTLLSIGTSTTSTSTSKITKIEDCTIRRKYPYRYWYSYTKTRNTKITSIRTSIAYGTRTEYELHRIRTSIPYRRDA
eukprot:CAMPEP_0168257326 /NCGR_PEP_ID=MMETSP0141_2-20121125/6446_1 /TAXON_ID=44445 /ORGANISM="Pseudo-nitzschia australis, Strain 10249 10 AB" /LENGTH=116 /DNA_ID=CAMNT_0008194321 /DNA_START=344 /DNA_END=691 /DNA_ORIENTATION=-